MPIPGQRVTDFAPRGYDKGRALARLRRRPAPEVVVYFGDSRADEAAYAILDRDDFGVRVGAGPSRARYRVRNPRDVARFLRGLLAIRGPSFRPN